MEWVHTQTGHSPSISNDGRWLAFGALTEYDYDEKPLPDSYPQVYLLDRQTDETNVISKDANNNGATDPAVWLPCSRKAGPAIFTFLATGDMWPSPRRLPIYCRPASANASVLTPMWWVRMPAMTCSSMTAKRMN